MPGLDEPPAGPLHDLWSALRELHRAAGKPAVRVISEGVKANDDLYDTVSHETINAMLRGTGITKWIKYQCAVKQLAIWSVDGRDPDSEVRRFHRLWLAASDTVTRSAPPAGPLVEDRPALPVTPPRPAKGLEVSRIAIHNLPNRNSHFSGRSAILAELRQAVASSVMVFLHGMGGVGKSQLAAEYAHLVAEDYDLLWWVPAEQPAAARAALARLGEQLGLRDRHDLRQAVTAVLYELETGQHRWLLVYDNATSPDDIAGLIPDNGGRVLLTTRDGAWLSRGIRVGVGVFARDESIDFLCRRGHEISADDAGLLAERLGDLPLALAQVAAMQATTTMPASQYLQLFDRHLDELLSTGAAGDSDNAFTTSVRLAFSGLRSDSPGAAQLLEMLAFASPDPVSLALLRSGSQAAISPPLGRVLQQSDGVDNLARRIERFGLCRLSPNGPRLQVHRLVQLVVRQALTETAASRVRADLHQLLSAIDPGSPDDPRSWATYNEIGSHLSASDAVHTSLPAMRDALLKQIRYHYQVGDFEESRDLATAALTAWDVPPSRGGLGPDHPQTYRAASHLANALRVLGDRVRSRQLVEDTLRRMREHLGEDHPETIALAGSVGPLLRLAGEYQAALEADQDRVDRLQRLYGSDSREAQAAEGNLAVNLRLLGDFRAAHDIDARVLQRRRKELGRTDPLTLISQRNLAVDHHGLGQYTQALDLFIDMLPLYSERLGADHRETLVTNRFAAVALRRVGRIEAALELSEAVYRSSGQRFGPDHEVTLAATSTYVNALVAAGQALSAHSIANESLGRHRRVFGERNPASLVAAMNFAVVLRAIGGWRDAYEIDTVTRNELSHILGEDHPFTLAATVGLAADLVHRDERVQAHQWLARAYQAYRLRFGEDHPDAVACEWNLAIVAAGPAAADFDQADNQTTKVLEHLREVLGSDDPRLLVAARRGWLECDVEIVSF